jgi:hypothetical protein
MDLSPARRDIVALIAAYAVALQMLFAAFVPMSFALPAEALAVLCSHDADGSDQPAQHDLPCAAMCAAMGQGIAGPLPVAAMGGALVPQLIAALIPAPDWGPSLIVVTGSHAPRGPPLA